MNLTRREAIKRMAILMGASAVGPSLLAGTFGLTTPLDFSDADIALLDEIGETIIPATHIPGARATNIGAFIAMMVADCYSLASQRAFRDGLDKLSADFEAQFREKFIGGELEKRIYFLNLLDAQQRECTIANGRPKDAAANGPKREDAPPHYFRVLRELTILGYFSSEIGSTQAIRYLEVPGRYDGNVLYKGGDQWFI